MRLLFLGHSCHQAPDIQGQARTQLAGALPCPGTHGCPRPGPLQLAAQVQLPRQKEAVGWGGCPQSAAKSE